MTDLIILGEYSPAIGWLVAAFFIHLISFCGPAAVSLWVAGRERPRAKVIGFPRREPAAPAAAASTAEAQASRRRAA